ncbi:MAG: hypothetical protein IKV73_02840, partial [Clostridia bacterium]|nr:hypothetical protein [Clostridia bacterium]
WVCFFCLGFEIAILAISAESLQKHTQTLQYAELAQKLLDVLGENLCRRSRSQFSKRISKSFGRQYAAKQ